MFTTNNNAQLIIKEKVEINPQSTISAYQVPAYTPCGPWITSYDYNNPWQVVWNQISFSPDPYQQMFNFQDNRYGPGLQRRTYRFDPNKIYNITLLQSDEYSYFTYGGFWDSNTGSYIPMQYAGTSLSGISGSDFVGDGSYVRDYPNGLFNNYESKYNLRIKRDVPPGTEIIMSVFDGQETINYHTRVETPTFTIQNDTPEEDTLLHNQSKEIDFYLNFQNNCQLDQYGGAYPTGIKFNVEIVQGQQYGNLYYPGTVANPDQSGISITNLEDEYGQGISNYVIRYTADGVQPDTSTAGIVTIRCSSNDLDILPAEVSFPIKYSNEPPPAIGGYILVDFNKGVFSPGDTATANCKWLTSYNEIIDFPGEQSFNAEIVSGKEYGMLLDPNRGTVADNLQGVSNGFRVLTPTSIPNDSVVIRIKVNTMAGDGGIIAAKIVNSQNQNSGKKQSKETDINKSIHSMSSTLSIGNPGGTLIEGFGDVVVKEDSCDEEIVICNNFEPQKFDDPGVGSIEKLISNAPWSWVDPITNTPKNTDAGEGCNNGNSGTDVGLTYVMSEISQFSQITPSVVYELSEDIIIETCIDERNPNEKLWRFKIKNVRVPIFADVCSTFISNRNFIDLRDGTDFSLLGSHITNCIEFRKVLDDLDWEINGGDYSFPCATRTSKYLFSTAIRAHEEKHFQDKAYYIKKELNENTLVQLQQMTRKKDDYPCPEAVLGPDNSGKTKRELFKILMSARIIKGANIDLHMGTSPVPCGIPPSMPVYFQYNSELEANKSAKQIYQEIRSRILIWGKMQSWYDPMHKLNCLGIN